MSRFRLIVLGADIVSVLTVFFFSAMPTQAKQCSTERPPNARSHWSYRLIDGRKCWYEGKPMLSKSLLHWPTSRAAQADSPLETDVLPANPYNPMDAQASISDYPDARPKAAEKTGMVDASPMSTPKRVLTPDNLRAWANSMAAMTTEPIVTILDRWPDEELPQHRTMPKPIKEPSLDIPGTIMMMTITFMALLALLAVLIAPTFRRAGWRALSAVSRGR